MRCESIESEERVGCACPWEGASVSFESLVPGLRARARRLSRSEADAEDLVQETLERALRFEGTYERGTNVRAWLQQILFSVYVSSCRRRRREQAALLLLERDPCAWTQHERGPVMTALSRPVERALAGLPTAYRDVVRLVDVEEKSYQEAADAIGVPIGTVMSRLFRGRRLLAAALSSEPPALAAPQAAA